MRWAHAVVLPNTKLADDFDAPESPRWMVADRTNLDELAAFLRDIPTQQQREDRVPTLEDVSLILEILSGRGQSQRDIVAEADERGAEADRLTEAQAMILQATRLLHRVEVRGGAGSGKTCTTVSTPGGSDRSVPMPPSQSPSS